LAALAGVDGIAQRLVVQKVGLLDVKGGAGALFLFLSGGPAFDAKLKFMYSSRHRV
jgi:hypothetical protein